ncbi:hypothetical protein POSPLADRAFT_1126987 [Postia placenta MAD-698-R-SB12]|uniref:DASH complex subunit ASK1 n=1 Tax=Postia placenta MAD-698-R-SB12 TaxID=670580 RepID=A0A1X6NES5_9APHY|nr:hypothetical protein POSPLADRAFT_1126987 [Postia placenta MAD-698-R-SB12]OSX67127.1 hypothetical protein POSPLADRAFT_1126987 [Postia placenta MAD-698-R-SB12]
MSSSLKPIEPKSARWEPTSDPNDIIVPGLDTNAPVNDQIEQIEQLITIKLQNVDANFSKMQHIMANRILPAVKRYAVATEPVREAARFWTTFFEQAAQIRVPTYEDYSSLQEQPEQETNPETDTDTAQGDASESESMTSDTQKTPTRSHHTFNSEGPSSDVSFLPQGAVSSTPATTSRHRTMQSNDSFASQGSDPTPSWTVSLESPLVRLDREIQGLAQEDEISHRTARYDETQEASQRQIPPPIPEEPSTVRRAPDNGKGKGRETQNDPPPSRGAEPLLQNVLLRNASFVDRTITSPRKPAVSPLKVKPRTPHLKSMNPYLPLGGKPIDWKGVVDLADPSVATPRKGNISSMLDPRARPTSQAQSTTPRFNADDSFDMDFGMSPPVTMDFARLPALGKTPKKEAAERILKNILDVEKQGIFAGAQGAGRGAKGSGAESTASSMPTPPSLSRYHPNPLGSETSGSVADASLESMMRRVGLALPGFAIPSVPRTRSPTRTPPSPPTHEDLQTPVQPIYDMRHLQDDELQGDVLEMEQEDSLDSLDSFDEVNDTANPSAAFLFASQRAAAFNDDDDDSFASDVIDDLPEGSSLEPVHPFARGLAADSFDDDDSFDDQQYTQNPEEETVFGVAPAQRLQIQQARESAGQNLRMLGADLLQNTIGISTQAGRVEETPTPFLNGR